MSKAELVKYVIRSNQIEHLRPSLRHPLFVYHLAAATMVAAGSSRTIFTPQQIHAVLMRGLLPARQVGRWRMHEVCVGDTNMPLASAVPSLMREYAWERDLITTAHHRRQCCRNDLRLLINHHFERGLVIRPFPDGNGRTFRLYYNSLLQYCGFPWKQYRERNCEWIDHLLQFRYHEKIFKNENPGLYAQRPVTL